MNDAQYVLYKGGVLYQEGPLETFVVPLDGSGLDVYLLTQDQRISWNTLPKNMPPKLQQQYLKALPREEGMVIQREGDQYCLLKFSFAEGPKKMVELLTSSFPGKLRFFSLPLELALVSAPPKKGAHILGFQVQGFWMHLGFCDARLHLIRFVVQQNWQESMSYMQQISGGQEVGVGEETLPAIRGQKPLCFLELQHHQRRQSLKNGVQRLAMALSLSAGVGALFLLTQAQGLATEKTKILKSISSLEGLSTQHLKSMQEAWDFYQHLTQEKP